jgi:hypothetical protein
MALTRMSWERRRRQGRTKALEQSGDWKGLLTHMALLSEAHGDHEEAARLRVQLHPQLMATPEPVYTDEPEPQPKRRSRRTPARSKLTRQQAHRLAWEKVMEKYRD